MKIIRELKNTINIEEVKEIYSKGNKIAFENDYSVNIGFLDRVGVDNGTFVDLSKENLYTIESVDIVENYEIFLKSGSLLKIDSIYKDDKEGEYLGIVKPFKGIHKDKILPLCFYNEVGIIIVDKVYEIEE